MSRKDVERRMPQGTDQTDRIGLGKISQEPHNENEPGIPPKDFSAVFTDEMSKVQTEELRRRFRRPNFKPVDLGVEHKVHVVRGKSKE